VFVDTNVLVYARDLTEPEKQQRAAEWLEHLWRSRTGRLSYQVLQEFYVALTAKLDPAVEPEVARAWVRPFLAWRPVVLDGQVLEGAWELQDDRAISWWDALIASAANISGARILLTEDLSDGEILGKVRVVNPFRTAPADLSRVELPR
jgi:predicted nucleic acid-binding protein